MYEFFVLRIFQFFIGSLYSISIFSLFFECSKKEDIQIIVFVSFCFTNLASDQSILEEKCLVQSRQLNESGPTGPAASKNSGPDSQIAGLGPALEKAWLYV